MAEQGKQEAKVERPAVRKVLLTEQVVFPGALGLGGVDSRAEVDCEGRTAVHRKATVTLTAYGPLVKYLADGRPTAEQARPASEWTAKLIPWRLVRGVEVSPEWRP